MNKPGHQQRFSSAGFIVFMSYLLMVSGCAPDGDISEWRRMTVSDQERQYHLFVPHGTLQGAERLALVINMHGATPAPQYLPTFASYFQQVISGMPKHAAEHGYIVVHPQSRTFEGQQHWDSSDTIDVEFINSLTDMLVSTLPIDPQQIFLSGFSSGGILAWKLACEYGDRYAAIAPVAANRRAAIDCPNAPAVPVVAFHGALDETVSFVSGVTAIENWAQQHQCLQREVVFQQDDTTCEQWRQCNDASEMRFCRSDVAGHTWPAGPGSFLISAAGYGRTSYTLNATDQIWAFFQSQSQLISAQR